MDFGAEFLYGTLCKRQGKGQRHSTCLLISTDDVWGLESTNDGKTFLAASGFHFIEKCILLLSAQRLGVVENNDVTRKIAMPR